MMPHLLSPQSSITEKSISENDNPRNQSTDKSTKKISKTRKIRKATSKKPKDKESSEQNTGPPNPVDLKITDETKSKKVTPSSALKRSRRLDGRQYNDKKKKDNDFPTNDKSSVAASGQSLIKKSVSDVSNCTPPKSAKQDETCNKNEQKNIKSRPHSHEKSKRMKSASPRRNGKKHIRKLDFSLPMEILNNHAFLLWFSERYQEFSRQYPKENVKELQDRRRPNWDQLDYRKKAPYYQRARNASCIHNSPPANPSTSKITEKTPNGVKVEPRSRDKKKSEPTTKSVLRGCVQRPFNFEYEFDQIVNDLIWDRQVYFEKDNQSENLTQILKDLADLETSGKLICAVK